MKHKKKYIQRLLFSHPTIFGMLKDSMSLSIARNSILGYIIEMIKLLNRESHRLEPLEWSNQNHSLLTFRKIISYRSERLAKFSLLKLLWNLAHENHDQLPDDLSDGFFEEMIHMFAGMQGRSGIYSREPFPEFAKMSGREASINRSLQLDNMAESCISTINKYPTGLDEDIIQIRQENKKRILRKLNGTDADWNNPAWHLRNVIRNADQLAKLINLKEKEREGIEKAVANRIPFGITPYYVSLMDREVHRKRDHAVRAQVIPPLDYVETMIRNRDDKNHSFDFMLERNTSPIDLITRRYPMIVILKPYNTCSQICVYCQRNWEIDNVLASRAMPPKKKIDAAIQWIQDHPTIREVLVTGGDPLVMSDGQLNRILSKLADIDHVERIRIGSRIPVVLPMRITDNLVDVISQYHKPGKRNLYLVTHFEHPYEVTPDAMEAVNKFKNHGISVYNQAVFTIENSRRFELVALRRSLRKIGVDPYYTFNTKGKEETKNYRVPLARLRQETKEEARLMSGLIRTDEPVYNVPGLGKNYLRAIQHHSIISILPNGRRLYEFHPWEKNLSLADTYVDTDVSIHDYLQRLKKRGEDIEEYETIWYYY